MVTGRMTYAELYTAVAALCPGDFGIQVATWCFHRRPKTDWTITWWPTNTEEQTRSVLGASAEHVLELLRDALDGGPALGDPTVGRDLVGTAEITPAVEAEHMQQELAQLHRLLDEQAIELDALQAERGEGKDAT